MAGANDEPEVKDVDVVHIQPAGDDEETVEPEATDPDSSQDETGDDPEGDEPEGENKPDALSQRQTTPAPEGAQAPEGQGEGGQIKRLPDETDREYALRLENNRLRTKLRGERSAELLDGQKPPASAKKELSPEKTAVLEKYKPEELQGLQEVLPILAEQMGFVRADDLAGTTYSEKAQESLDAFLDKHPEYTPEKDPDGTLWNAFKSEYGMYKQPSNPKDFSKIFERIHRDVFGIKPKGDLTKVNAGKEKVRIASHTVASQTPAVAPTTRQRAAAPQGLRTDMLKGFTDEEKAELLED